MTTPGDRSLGRLIAVHPIAPAVLQRAVFIAVLSFMFFLGTMLAFYLRQNLLYFLLATAFLIVYLVMMLALLVQRKSAVEVCERGLRFKKNAVTFDEIDAVTDTGEITLNDRKKIALPKSVVNFDGLIATVRSRLG